MPAPRTVLLTGAAGGVGTLMRERLPAYGYGLRLLDVVPVPGAPDAVVADLADRAALREAVRGADAVVHLAGISLEDDFDAIVAANVTGTHHLYEAVREEGVRRVVSASGPRHDPAPPGHLLRPVHVLRRGPGPAVLGPARGADALAAAQPRGLRPPPARRARR